jgi:hypothetical protein
MADETNISTTGDLKPLEFDKDMDMSSYQREESQATEYNNV